MDTKQNLNFHDFKTNKRLSFTGLGMGTARYDGLLPHGDQLKVLIPCGPSLFLYNPQSGMRELCLQENNSAIYSIVRNSKHIFVIGYGGDVVVLRNEPQISVVTRFQAASREIRFVSVNEKWLSLSQEDDKYKVHEVFHADDFSSTRAPKLVLRNEPFIFGQLIDETLLLLVSVPIDKRRETYYIRLYSIESGQQLRQQLHLPYVSEIICARTTPHIAAFLYSDRKILLFDIQNWCIAYFGDIAGSGAIQMMHLQEGDHNLTLFPQKGYRLQIKLKAGIVLPPVLPNSDKEVSNTDFYSISKFPAAIAHPQTFAYALVPSQSLGIVHVGFNENGLIYHSEDTQKELYRFQHANLSCCGAAVNAQGTLVAVGDLIGNVLLYNIESAEGNSHPLQTIFVFGGVRSLEWGPDKENYILVGLLDGLLQKVYIAAPSAADNTEVTEQIQTVFQCEGSITSVRLRSSDQQHLLLTDTCGYLTILDLSRNFTPILRFLCHNPAPLGVQQQLDAQQQDLRFGSLHLRAEIWSCCWDTNDQQLSTASKDSAHYVATCSEDQNVHIVKLEEGGTQAVVTQVLRGSRLAVTCVDWQRMDEQLGGGGEIFAACSDDQTVRVYAPQNNFALVQEISTSFVEEWHTLTYLSLELRGTRVAFGAQNGYLYIYDLLRKQFLFAEKVHLGGIEGLVWRHDKVVTCANDCTVNVVRV